MHFASRSINLTRDDFREADLGSCRTRRTPENLVSTLMAQKKSDLKGTATIGLPHRRFFTSDDH
jgi:hypothetical protein